MFDLPDLPIGSSYWDDELLNMENPIFNHRLEVADVNPSRVKSTDSYPALMVSPSISPFSKLSTLSPDRDPEFRVDFKNLNEVFSKTLDLIVGVKQYTDQQFNRVNCRIESLEQKIISMSEGSLNREVANSPIHLAIRQSKPLSLAVQYLFKFGIVTSLGHVCMVPDNLEEEDHLIIALPIFAKFLGACTGDYPSYSQKIICTLLTKLGARTITGTTAQKRNYYHFYCDRFGMKIGKKNIKTASEQSRISKFLMLRRDLFLDAVDASFKEHPNIDITLVPVNYNLLPFEKSQAGVRWQPEKFDDSIREYTILWLEKLQQLRIRNTSTEMEEMKMTNLLFHISEKYSIFQVRPLSPSLPDVQMLPDLPDHVPPKPLNSRKRKY
jgi:hypothetical protein